MRTAWAPLRISFAGGGTDLPSYYRNHGGAVIGATLSLGVSTLRVAHEDLTSIPTGFEPVIFESNVLAREGLRYARQMGYELFEDDLFFTRGSVSPGSGLGSSAAFLLSFLGTLAPTAGLSLYDRAKAASSVEIDFAGRPVGHQDHFLSAYGGINELRFGTDDHVGVHELRADPPALSRLSDHLLLFDLRQLRDAGGVLKDQHNRSMVGDRRTLDRLTAIKQLTDRAGAAVATEQYQLLGQTLHEGWLVKRGVSASISNTAIDEAYKAAIQAGAWGGKVTGAGGGGHLLLVASRNRQGDVRDALMSLELHEVPCRITPAGFRIESALS